MSAKILMMKKPKKRWKTKKWSSPAAFHLGRMLPNLVTLCALCMGLTSIHFAFLQQWQHAVASIFIAGVLDGIDGRLARLLNSSTDFGAELDSLADFINFGVAPALCIYFFSLHTWGGVGWALCLFFACCVALRLARFNIERDIKTSGVFSTGVPAPAGAMLAFLPILFWFVFDIAHPLGFAISTVSSALLMISRYPTYVFKKLMIKKEYKGLFLIAMVMLMSSLVTMPWETLLAIACFYVVSLPISGYSFYAVHRNRDLSNT